MADTDLLNALTTPQLSTGANVALGVPSSALPQVVPAQTVNVPALGLPQGGQPGSVNVNPLTGGQKSVGMRADGQTQPAQPNAAQPTAPPTTGDPYDDMTNRIIQIESGGRANAQNPNSSASGLGQFTDGTWLSSIKKYRPDLAAGKTDAQLLGMKNDPTLGRAMTKSLAQDNGQQLQAAGIEATPGNVYAAHFLGIGGAKQLLSHPDDAQLNDILSKPVLSANGFLEGMTVKDFKNWAAGKMGGASGGATGGATGGSGPQEQSASVASGEQSNSATAGLNPKTLQTLMALQMLQPHLQFTPVTYDPFKIQQLGESRV